MAIQSGSDTQVWLHNKYIDLQTLAWNIQWRVLLTNVYVNQSLCLFVSLAASSTAILFCFVSRVSQENRKNIVLLTDMDKLKLDDFLLNYL